SQDWPTDNARLQSEAQRRVLALTQTLKKEKRTAEADKLQAALQNLRQRDVVINLTWQAELTNPADLEMVVQEPCGSTCSSAQKQTPGGGTMLGSTLTENKISYVAAQGFAGDYEITVRRNWGQPLGGRARLEIIQNVGTPKETRRLEIVQLD